MHIASSTELYRGPWAVVRDVCCRRDGEEESHSHKLVFTRRGVYVKGVGHKIIVADPNHALFFNHHEPYLVRHPAPGGADCTALDFSAEGLLQALETEPYATGYRDKTPFARAFGPVPARTLQRMQRLRQQLGSPKPDLLEVEETILALLRDALETTQTAWGRGRPRRTARLPRARVEAVKLLLAQRPQDRHSLSELAAAVHCSPFHLARQFRGDVGMPIHRYLTRLRLALALERLPEAKGDLSHLALDLGFASHSHLTATFAAVFGFPPSSFQSRSQRAKLAEMRKILKA